ncbi:hypothetical protein [Paenibacillus hunanensis]|uniref:Acriflavin resistance protein n=1 Tax=Paenibacillus hunanensis TaxID=539262 RepID=A0ABU1IVN9_9BACL|nr:hypothetical protein [Paenibacillus hunanensis]MCL9662891.1 hypothetical protein [Paenibacillus hunanensis]MDR6243080.1 hypothetical protein [Paenibacillus hunanensis]GGJ12048.1 hypothetical protein GCM10008022_21450 [Paenibacillus hunanensis]
MKLRALPVIITALVSVAVLFGGFFAYRQLTLYKPLMNMVTAYPGVNSAQISINQKEVDLKLDLKSNADLGSIMEQFNKQSMPIVGARKVKLEVEDHSDQQLNNIWENAMFPVSQAMANRQYTDIPKTMQQIAGKNSGITAKAQMDDRNVYVSISNGKASKFLILPLSAQATGGNA